MKTNTLFTLLLATTLIFSCSPGDNDPPPTDDPQLIYYDYMTAYPNSLVPNGLDSFHYMRVCYDLSSQSVVWRKKNSKIIPLTDWEVNWPDYGHDLTNTFQTENEIIRIYHSTATQRNGSHLIVTKIDAVNFQRINKQTGEETVTTLIPDSEIPDQSEFSISKVVEKNGNYFFHAVNGSVYCVRQDGTIKWKKDGYPPANTNTYGDGTAHYSYVYLYENKVYIMVYEPPPFETNVTLLGLNIETGEEEYAHGGMGSTPWAKQLLFSKTHFAVVNSPAVTLYKYGEPFPKGDHLVNQLLHTDPITAWDDNVFVYLYNTRVKSIDVRDYIRQNTLPGIFHTDRNYIYSNKKLYGGLIGHSSLEFFFTCFNPDPDNGGIVWSKVYPRNPASLGKLDLYKYFLKDGKLYIFTSFTVENNMIMSNIPTANNNTSGGAILIVMDAATGDILKQYKDIPIADPNENTRYTTGMFHIIMGD